VNIDSKRIGAVGSIIAALAVLHGLRSRRWRYIHTFGVGLGVASAVLPLLEGRPHRSAAGAEAG
jgi:hypothetical protein